MKNQNTIRGNALFMILIAIVLLGGLTVLLTRTGSQTEETGSTERLSVSASEVMKYANGIKGAVEQLRAKGCSEVQISFWSDSNGDGVENGSDDYYNSGAPTDRSCHVFRPEGGGQNANTIKTEWLDSTKSALESYQKYFFTGAAHVAGVVNVSPDRPELLLIISYLTQGMCSEINKRLGISVIPEDYGTFPSPAVAPWKYTGTFSATTVLGDDTGLPNYSVIGGKKAICIKTTTEPAANTYQLIQVLISR